MYERSQILDVKNVVICGKPLSVTLNEVGVVRIIGYTSKRSWLMAKRRNRKRRDKDTLAECLFDMVLSMIILWLIKVVLLD